MTSRPWIYGSCLALTFALAGCDPQPASPGTSTAPATSETRRAADAGALAPKAEVSITGSFLGQNRRGVVTYEVVFHDDGAATFRANGGTVVQRSIDAQVVDDFLATLEEHDAFSKTPGDVACDGVHSGSAKREIRVQADSRQFVLDRSGRDFCVPWVEAVSVASQELMETSGAWEWVARQSRK